MQNLRPSLQDGWSFDIVAVRPGLQVQQLRHVTGQPLSPHQQARLTVGQTLADWPTIGVLLREAVSVAQADILKHVFKSWCFNFAWSSRCCAMAEICVWFPSAVQCSFVFSQPPQTLAQEFTAA